MDMNYVYGQCMYCIGLDPKYALICLCVMHDMYMFMPELPTEYAAHPSQNFFQVVVTFLQVLSDRFCIASTAGVRSPSSSARHDSLHLKGLTVYLRPVVCIFVYH